MRNRSLTKDEVAAFWRRQQQQGRPAAPEPNAGSPGAEILVPHAANKRQLEATRSLPPLLAGRGATRSNDDDLTCCAAYGRYGAGDQQLVSSRSEPPSPAATARGEGFFLPVPENAAAADSSGMSRGWWTRSSWAFLNEPPPTREEVVLGRAQRSFACDQFHAARIVTGNA
ncbi:hypothetical protein BDA96_01G029800 [Sorghum bicolor]|nr:hypothetical protein BDA96_01G029800 [Sorghum bicolor]